MAINALDPSQKYALKAISDGKHEGSLSLVYGPPGTGKSQLLVSLLFELATKGKKILFVSQNTEALEVIERMITGLEKDMKLNEDNLSFADFCLKLYTREHRYLKYMRAQSQRLGSRILPTVDTYEDQPVSTDHDYELSYINLDRAMNYTITADKIGMDELLRYFLQYVGSDLAVEVLHNFNSIDLRQIFSSLDKYRLRDDFSYYNQPQNELRFVTTTNPRVTLSDIQAGIERLGVVMSRVDGNMPAPQADTNVEDYLVHLRNYEKLQGHLNLYRIQADALDIDNTVVELKASLGKVPSLLEDGQIINGLEMINRPLFTDTSQVKFLDAETFNEYAQDLQSITKIIDVFRRHDKELLSFDTKDLLFSLLKKINLDVATLLEKIPDLLERDVRELESILVDTREHAKKGKLERIIKQLPNSYKTLLPNAKRGDPDLILRYGQALETLIKLLEDTNIKLKTYKQLADKTRQHRQAVNLFADADESKVISLTNKILHTVELTRRYGIKHVSLKDLDECVGLLTSDMEVYQSVVAANRSKVIHLSSTELVDGINATIGHNLARAAINSHYEKYARYLCGCTSAQEFINFLPDILKLLTEEKKKIQETCTSLALPAEYRATENLVRLEDLESVIGELKHDDLYSSTFFVVAAGQTLPLWYDMVKNVRHFHNVEELDSYLEHHLFVSVLKTSLVGNEPWLDELLRVRNISFYDFCSRLVNSLVRTSFQNLPSTKRKIMPAAFFGHYEAKLKKNRRTYYVEGLKYLSGRTFASARHLSNPNNWRPGVSTMEKIRNNTNIVKEAFPVVIATPKEVAKYIAPDKEMFDYVIFDEASQLLPGQALPAVFRAKKAVIIGDPHQMPPSLIAAIAGAGNEEDEDLDTADSILDLAKNMQPEAQYHLKVHYRSESNKLFQPSRDVIYAQDGIEPIYEAQMYDAAPISISDNLGFGLDQSGQYDKNFRNIVTRISEHLEEDPKATFCILFLRAEDLHAFKDYLATYEAALGQIYKLYSENKILISTITNCQGIEGTYSILYFRHYDSPGAMWFFRESAGAYKRLNVAITRQRRGLSLLLADSREKWLQVCEAKIDNTETPPNTRKSAELLRILLNSAGEVMDTEYLDRHLADSSLQFESPLIEQVYKMLRDCYKDKLDNEIKIYCGVGWHMLIPDDQAPDGLGRNIGFKIDIGIYSMRHKRFVLGIEIDDSAYHANYDKEHSDYERRTALKTKGWDLYRIWSTNWLNGQVAELDSLMRAIDSRL